MYDLIIIGGGPAGYVAAEQAGGLGKKALLVERDPHLGGVCLNTGCIPTKTMLHCATLYANASEGDAFGVHAEELRFDYAAVRKHVDKTVDRLRKGVRALMRQNKVDVKAGDARITGRTAIRVNDETYEGEHLLVCTGSRPYLPPIDGLKNNDRVLTNADILALDEMPDRLAIIGAGIIGCEFACLYACAGKEVVVVEMLDHVGGDTEPELAKVMQKELHKRGVTFHLQATVNEVDGATIKFQDKKGKERTFEADAVLVATGRSANTEGFGLEDLGVDAHDGRIQVDDRARTNVPGAYAAGDVTGRQPFAHFAYRQGTVAVQHMFGQDAICREDAVPAVIYTDPELASVGLTEAEAREQGREVKTAKFPLTNNGRYLAETRGQRGLAKAVVGAQHGELLGMHIVAPHASEMIATAAVMIETELRAPDIRELIFPHPTISEALRDVLHGV